MKYKYASGIIKGKKCLLKIKEIVSDTKNVLFMKFEGVNKIFQIRKNFKKSGFRFFKDKPIYW